MRPIAKPASALAVRLAQSPKRISNRTAKTKGSNPRCEYELELRRPGDQYLAPRGRIAVQTSQPLRG